MGRDTVGNGRSDPLGERVGFFCLGAEFPDCRHVAVCLSARTGDDLLGSWANALSECVLDTYKVGVRSPVQEK